MAQPDHFDESVLSKVQELRDKFFKTHSADVDGGCYDDRDLDRIRGNDIYVACFVRSFSEKGDLVKPVAMIDAVLRFRKDIQLNDLTPSSFPKDLEERHFLYWGGVDKENRKVLHFKVTKHQKGKQVQEVRNYVAMMLEAHHRAHLGVRVVLIFDCMDAGVTNMDLDLVRYIITCLSTYFPGILAFILLFEMPWLLSSVWKVIRGWLSEEQRSRIIHVKKADMLRYISADQLEPHML